MPESLAERPRDLLVAGHVNVDRFLRVRAFPAPDRTVPILRMQAKLGGTATNLALVASQLGLRTGIVALLGEGFPPEFAARLRERGVDARGLGSVAGASTPTCYIVVDRRGHQRTLIDQGAMATRRPISLPNGFLGEYAWLHVTTGPPDPFLALVREARRSGLRVAADPAQEIHYRWDARRFRALLEDSEILFGNRSEIAQACRLGGVSDPSHLVERIPLIVRTEGIRGASAFARGVRLHVAAERPARVHSIVGAGDAFRGGFYSGWFRGRPLERCLRDGVHAAAQWVQHPGE